MLPADEIQRVCEGLWCWQRYQPSVKVECSSVALRLEAGLVFIDPIPLADEALSELLEFAKPEAIVLTNGNHARNAAALRRRWDIPVWAHPAAADELGITVDHPAIDGAMLFDTLTVTAVAGAPPGEIALHDPRGWLHVGDALTHLEPDGLALLPAKYCTAPRELPGALRKLLRFEFEVLTFAHGLPLVARARPRLEALLA